MATQMKTSITQHEDWDGSVFWTVEFQAVAEEWQDDDADRPVFVIGFTDRDALVDALVGECLDRVTIETVLEDVDETLRPTVCECELCRSFPRRSHVEAINEKFYPWTLAFLTLVVAWLAWRSL